MNIPEITTSVSSVRIVENNLLHWVYSKDAVVTLKEAEEEVARVGALVEEKALKSTRLLIDIRPLCSIDRAASKLFASDQVHDRYGVEALGLLIKSRVSSAIGNFYMKVRRPKHPTRLFTNEDDARQWLAEFA